MKCSNIAATKYYAIPEGFEKEYVVQIKILKLISKEQDIIYTLLSLIINLMKLIFIMTENLMMSLLMATTLKLIY